MPFELVIPMATRLAVSLTGGPVACPAAGYRQWNGQFVASEPIVALVAIQSGEQLCWTRTSHRGGTSLETRISFSPFDAEARRITASFGILDAIATSETLVDSALAQPMPRLDNYTTGKLIEIALVETEPACVFKVLFLARADVASVRNGVWHARNSLIPDLKEPWRKILTYGRTGELSLAEIH